MTFPDPDTDALLAGADVEVPTDAPASGVHETDLPPPATDAENDDVSVNPTSA
jgi:hypothetical protein